MPAKKAAEETPASEGILAEAERKPDKLAVELAVDNDNARYDAGRLVAYLGGSVSSSKGTSLVVEVPPTSERNTSAAHTKLVQGLLASPLVSSVEVA